MVPAVTSNPTALTAKNAAAGLCLLLGLLIVLAWLSGGGFLLSRDLWMDEVHSWLIVTDADTAHSMQALADGADFNPPSWFLTSRVLTSHLLPATEISLRLLSLTWMLLALSGLYLLLARHFTPIICVTSVMLTACHPLLIHQSTEIRFYGFWCALIVWLCYATQWPVTTRFGSTLKLLSISILAALISTCHYFGILSLVLVAAPLLLILNSPKQHAAIAGLIIGSGITALTCCLPFLAGQKAAISRPTWVSAPTFSDSLLFLQTLFPAWQAALCIIAVLLTVMFFRPRVASAERLFRCHPHDRAAIVPCICLSAMSLLIVGVSWTLQPALVARYAIVGVLGATPLLALLLHQCSAHLCAGILLISVGAFSRSTNGCVEQWKAADGDRAQLVLQLRKCPANVVVFEDRIIWMPLLHKYPELATICRLAEYEDTQLQNDSNLRIVQRDVGRRIEKWYPQYSLQKIDALDTYSHFYVVPYAEEAKCGLLYPAVYEPASFSASIVRFSKDPL
jgi:hypothetical protein